MRGQGFRFPDHARGFLYLHQQLNEPMESSIRLRCTQSNDPATFDQGKDLIRYAGQPWNISMSTILHSRSSYIRDYFLHAGILTNHQIVRWQSSQKYPSPKGPLRIRPFLSTLKPDELLPEDFVDMSFKPVEAISFAGVPASDKAELRYCHSGYQSRFPVHARGFLYYHQPMNMPPIAASIRLRCTSSHDPATFSQGKDLLNPNGLPWEVGMPTILSIRSPQIRDYLLHARIVVEAQMLQWKHALNLKRPDQPIYRLDQPFLVNFRSSCFRLMAIVGDFAGYFPILHIFRDRRSQYFKSGLVGGTFPYKGLLSNMCLLLYQSHDTSLTSGLALARFELSTLPEHSGDHIIVMRILKFIEPVTCIIQNYDGRLPFPREGDLFHRQRHQVFTCRIDQDNPTSQCLKRLVEDYLTSKSPMTTTPFNG
jgi:hypothetical protein